jgi:hypothetical protein
MVRLKQETINLMGPVSVPGGDVRPTVGLVPVLTTGHR